MHPDYPVLRAPRGFLVSYSLPPVAIALGRRALNIARATLATRGSRGVSKVAESEVAQTGARRGRRNEDNRESHRRDKFSLTLSAATFAVREGESLRFIFCLLGPSGARQPCDGAWRRACLSEITQSLERLS